MKFTFRDYQVKNDLIKRLVPLNANSLAKGEVRVFLWQPLIGQDSFNLPRATTPQQTITNLAHSETKDLSKSCPYFYSFTKC